MKESNTGCKVPSLHELKKKIKRSKQLLKAGKALPMTTTVDFLDLARLNVNNKSTYKEQGHIHSSDFETGELLVVDIARSMVTDRIKVGEMLFGMALDKVGITAYICDLKSNSVSMVDIGSKKIDKITWAEGVSSHCAIDEKGRQLVVACQGGLAGGPVHIIDLETKTVTATIVDDKLHGSIGVTIDPEIPSFKGLPG